MCRGGMFYTWPGHSDGAAVIAMHCKPLGCEFKSGSYLYFGDVNSCGVAPEIYIQV